MPSIGGNVPTLETQNVRLKQDYIRVYTKSKKKASCFGCGRSSKKHYEQKENFIECDRPLEIDCEIDISNLTTKVNIKHIFQKDYRQYLKNLNRNFSETIISLKKIGSELSFYY